MASSPTRIAAMAELTRAPLKQPAAITIEPPGAGYMRIHLSLAELTSNAVTLSLDILPTRSEVGSVRVNR